MAPKDRDERAARRSKSEKHSTSGRRDKSERSRSGEQDRRHGRSLRSREEDLRTEKGGAKDRRERGRAENRRDSSPRRGESGDRARAAGRSGGKRGGLREVQRDEKQVSTRGNQREGGESRNRKHNAAQESDDEKAREEPRRSGNQETRYSARAREGRDLGKADGEKTRTSGRNGKDVGSLVFEKHLAEKRRSLLDSYAEEQMSRRRPDDHKVPGNGEDARDEASEREKLLEKLKQVRKEQEEVGPSGGVRNEDERGRENDRRQRGGVKSSERSDGENRTAGKGGVRGSGSRSVRAFEDKSEKRGVNNAGFVDVDTAKESDKRRGEEGTRSRRKAGDLESDRLHLKKPEQISSDPFNTDLRATEQRNVARGGDSLPQEKQSVEKVTERQPCAASAETGPLLQSAKVSSPKASQREPKASKKESLRGRKHPTVDVGAVLWATEAENGRDEDLGSPLSQDVPCWGTSDMFTASSRKDSARKGGSKGRQPDAGEEAEVCQVANAAAAGVPVQLGVEAAEEEGPNVPTLGRVEEELERGTPEQGGEADSQTVHATGLARSPQRASEAELGLSPPAEANEKVEEQAEGGRVSELGSPMVLQGLRMYASDEESGGDPVESAERLVTEVGVSEKGTECETRHEGLTTVEGQPPRKEGDVTSLGEAASAPKEDAASDPKKSPLSVDPAAEALPDLPMPHLEDHTTETPTAKVPTDVTPGQEAGSSVVNKLLELSKAAADAALQTAESSGKGVLSESDGVLPAIGAVDLDGRAVNGEEASDEQKQRVAASEDTQRPQRDLGSEEEDRLQGRGREGLASSQLEPAEKLGTKTEGGLGAEEGAVGVNAKVVDAALDTSLRVLNREGEAAEPSVKSASKEAGSKHRVSEEAVATNIAGDSKAEKSLTEGVTSATGTIGGGDDEPDLAALAAVGAMLPAVEACAPAVQLALPAVEPDAPAVELSVPAVELDVPAVESAASMVVNTLPAAEAAVLAPLQELPFAEANALEESLPALPGAGPAEGSMSAPADATAVVAADTAAAGKGVAGGNESVALPTSDPGSGQLQHDPENQIDRGDKIPSLEGESLAIAKSGPRESLPAITRRSSGGKKRKEKAEPHALGLGGLRSESKNVQATIGGEERLELVVSSGESADEESDEEERGADTCRGKRVWGPTWLDVLFEEGWEDGCLKGCPPNHRVLCLDCADKSVDQRPVCGRCFNAKKHKRHRTGELRMKDSAWCLMTDIITELETSDLAKKKYHNGRLGVRIWSGQLRFLHAEGAGVCKGCNLRDKLLPSGSLGFCSLQCKAFPAPSADVPSPLVEEEPPLALAGEKSLMLADGEAAGAANNDTEGPTKIPEIPGIVSGAGIVGNENRADGMEQDGIDGSGRPDVTQRREGSLSTRVANEQRLTEPLCRCVEGVTDLPEEADVLNELDKEAPAVESDAAKIEMGPGVGSAGVELEEPIVPAAEEQTDGGLENTASDAKGNQLKASLEEPAAEALKGAPGDVNESPMETPAMTDGALDERDPLVASSMLGAVWGGSAPPSEDGSPEPPKTRAQRLASLVAGPPSTTPEGAPANDTASGDLMRELGWLGIVLKKGWETDICAENDPSASHRIKQVLCLDCPLMERPTCADCCRKEHRGHRMAEMQLQDGIWLLMNGDHNADVSQIYIKKAPSNRDGVLLWPRRSNVSFSKGVKACKNCGAQTLVKTGTVPFSFCSLTCKVEADPIGVMAASLDRPAVDPSSAKRALAGFRANQELPAGTVVVMFVPKPNCKQDVFGFHGKQGIVATVTRKGRHNVNRGSHVNNGENRGFVRSELRVVGIPKGHPLRADDFKVGVWDGQTTAEELTDAAGLLDADGRVLYDGGDPVPEVAAAKSPKKGSSQGAGAGKDTRTAGDIRKGGAALKKRRPSTLVKEQGGESDAEEAEDGLRLKKLSAVVKAEKKAKKRKRDHVLPAAETEDETVVATEDQRVIAAEARPAKRVSRELVGLMFLEASDIAEGATRPVRQAAAKSVTKEQQRRQGKKRSLASLAEEPGESAPEVEVPKDSAREKTGRGRKGLRRLEKIADRGVDRVMEQVSEPDVHLSGPAEKDPIVEPAGLGLSSAIGLETGDATNPEEGSRRKGPKRRKAVVDDEPAESPTVAADAGVSGSGLPEEPAKSLPEGIPQVADRVEGQQSGRDDATASAPITGDPAQSVEAPDLLAQGPGSPEEVAPVESLPARGKKRVRGMAEARSLAPPIESGQLVTSPGPSPRPIRRASQKAKKIAREVEEEREIDDDGEFVGLQKHREKVPAARADLSEVDGLLTAPVQPSSGPHFLGSGGAVPAQGALAKGRFIPAGLCTELQRGGPVDNAWAAPILAYVDYYVPPVPANSPVDQLVLFQAPGKKPLPGGLVCLDTVRLNDQGWKMKRSGWPAYVVHRSARTVDYLVDVSAQPTGSFVGDAGWHTGSQGDASQAPGIVGGLAEGLTIPASNSEPLPASHVLPTHSQETPFPDPVSQAPSFSPTGHGDLDPSFAIPVNHFDTTPGVAVETEEKAAGLEVDGQDPLLSHPGYHTECQGPTVRQASLNALESPGSKRRPGVGQTRSTAAAREATCTGSAVLALGIPGEGEAERPTRQRKRRASAQCAVRGEWEEQATPVVQSALSAEDNPLAKHVAVPMVAALIQQPLDQSVGASEGMGLEAVTQFKIGEQQSGPGPTASLFSPGSDVMGGASAGPTGASLLGEQVASGHLAEEPPEATAPEAPTVRRMGRPPKKRPVVDGETAEVNTVARKGRRPKNNAGGTADVSTAGQGAAAPLPTTPQKARTARKGGRPSMAGRRSTGGGAGVSQTPADVSTAIETARVPSRPSGPRGRSLQVAQAGRSMVAIAAGGSNSALVSGGSGEAEGNRGGALVPAGARRVGVRSGYRSVAAFSSDSDSEGEAEEEDEEPPEELVQMCKLFEDVWTDRQYIRDVVFYLHCLKGVAMTKEYIYSSHADDRVQRLMTHDRQDIRNAATKLWDQWQPLIRG